MQLRNYSQAVLAAMLLAILKTQSSLAASITYDTNGDSHISFDKVSYTQGNRVGQSWVEQPLLLQPGGTPGLRRLLQKYFPDWTFLIAPPIAGDKSLIGEFRVRQYYACGNLTDCGNPSTESFTGGIGALFAVDFIPGQGDPQSNQIKWIGRVVSNHSQLPSPDGSYGLIEDRIDNLGRTDSPYYFPSANNSNFSTSFSDRPYRGDPQDNHSWYGELFLVREIGPKTVVIYDGISWGWGNQTKFNATCSTSSSQCPPPPPCIGGSGGGGCTINAVNGVKDTRTSVSLNDNNSESSLSVRDSTLSLLALAAWGVVKALKIRKDKQS